MEQGDREIEVRTLTGESTTISISPNMTIEDLKVLLKQNFLPAATSPKFHLFLKGVKLSLERRISDAIAPEDFILLVPFAKKSRLQTQQAHHSDMLSEASSHSPASKFANLAWSDMMNDLSLLGNALTNGSQTHYDSEIMNFDRSNGAKVGDPVKHSLEKISKTRVHDAKPEELPDVLVSTILQSPCENFVNQNCEALIKVLELVTCLSDPQSGECFLLREACRVDTCLCLCPPWLKILVKAFAFLNVFSAYCQLHHEEVTLNRLSEALNLLGKSGPQIGILDMKNLSCLCPKAIHFGCQRECTNNSYSIVVVDSSSAQINQVESTTKKALKRLSLSKIVNVMKKRERSFRKTLWESIKLLTWKNGHKVDIFFSLDDLLELVKERNTIASGNGAKRTKRKWSTPSTSQLVQTRCCDLNHLLPEEMVRHLRVGIGSSGQMVHVEDIGAREANYVDLPDELSETTKSALQRIGISRLYSHQAQSIRASLAGKNVVVATMTSSGKSLCYNLPVLEALSKNLQSCALYLFPTKALSQDQLRALLAMIEGYDACLNIGVYDGDTSPEERTWLCDNARLLITNPDMLHVSILPFHSQFRRILSNLRFLVIDEAHIYKGAFGCHSALILRRLRRLCSHVYGSDPSFVFCTATSANPREHAMELANLKKLELIQNDGSPSGRKFFILWNPPLCMKTVPDTAKSSKKMNKFMDRKVVSRRSSSIMEISLLFAEMIQHGLRSIAFCKTRKLCELVLCYTREILQEVAPELVNSICSYRGGYMAEDRRRIERDFFNGKLSGIAATNALELGIDVGHIDVTLHLGFPGSIASLWQQAGRSGRRERPSLSIYVAFEGPLDQYFMNCPQKLFRSSIECCHIDAQNHQVLEQHLACAAFEHPLSLLFDEKHFGTGLSNAVISLKDKGLLSVDLSRDASVRIWSYIGHEKMPSREVGIRAIEAEKYLVIDKERNEIIEEIEESKAFFQVYEGAVYMNQGKTYLVKELDISRKIAFCHKSDLKYYTKTRDYTDIHVIGGEIAYPAQVSANKFKKGAARMNTCKVTTAWFGFYRIWRGSNRVFDTVELSLPTYSYESQAVWIRVPQSIKSAVESENLLFRPGLHAASHALLNVVPLHVICNLSDLAPECANPHDKRFVPERILLYDQHPGGTGIVAQVLPRFGDLLIAAYELLKSCRCQGDTGCPNCIQSIACHEYNEVLHKDAAIMIIKGVLDADAETLNSG